MLKSHAAMEFACTRPFNVRLCCLLTAVVIIGLPVKRRKREIIKKQTTLPLTERHAPSCR